MKKLFGTLMMVVALLALGCGAGTPTSLPENGRDIERELRDPRGGVDPSGEDD